MKIKVTSNCGWMESVGVSCSGYAKKDQFFYPSILSLLLFFGLLLLLLFQQSAEQDGIGNVSDKLPEQLGNQNEIGNVFDKLTKQLGNPVEFELPDWSNKLQSAPYILIKRSILQN